MALVLRHNGAPLSGALFVRNPHKRKARKARRTKLRLNGSRRRRSAKLKLRLNRRRNPSSYLLNRKHRRLHLRRNPSTAGDFGSVPVVGKYVTKVTGMATGLLRKIPYIGGTLATAAPTALFGLSVAGLGYGALMLANRYAPTMIMNRIAPVAGTSVALVSAVVLNKFPVNIGSPKLRTQLGGGLVVAGILYDAYRAIKGTSHTLAGVDELGDGMAYDVVPLGDIDGLAMGGLAMGDADFGSPEDMGLMADYADAEMGDAELCGADFGQAEGEALLAGPECWRSTFGAPPILRTRTKNRHSRHAQKPGHRWGWLIKLVGPARARQIAQMEPDDRIELIQKLRQQAIATVNASGGAGGDLQGLAMSGLAMSGLAMSGHETHGLAMSGTPGYGDLFAGSAY